jgi:hypothetical protein
VQIGQAAHCYDHERKSGDSKGNLIERLPRYGCQKQHGCRGNKSNSEMTLVAIRSVPELAEVKGRAPMAATATMIEMDVKGAEYKAGPMAIGLLPLRNATKM